MQRVFFAEAINLSKFQLPFPPIGETCEKAHSCTGQNVLGNALVLIPGRNLYCGGCGRHPCPCFDLLLHGEKPVPSQPRAVPTVE